MGPSVPAVEHSVPPPFGISRSDCLKLVTSDAPWLMPEVIEWLEHRAPWLKVLETGAGGSTVFFAERGSSVLSYEHAHGWTETVRRNLQERALSHRVTLCCDPFYPARGLNIPAGAEFDLAFIDGRGRVRSVIDALPHVRPGGWLILDDSDRGWYAEARRVMDAAAAAKITFRSGPDETTAWRKL